MYMHVISPKSCTLFSLPSYSYMKYRMAFYNMHVTGESQNGFYGCTCYCFEPNFYGYTCLIKIIIIIILSLTFMVNYANWLQLLGFF